MCLTWGTDFSGLSPRDCHELLAQDPKGFTPQDRNAPGAGWAPEEGEMHRAGRRLAPGCTLKMGASVA